MEERLLRLLDTEQLSSSKFADVIGVQRSSISHILSGRNKPSFDFLQKTLKAFPMLNADWLILGEGEMYENGLQAGSGSLFNQGKGDIKPADTEVSDEVDELELNQSDSDIADIAPEENESGASQEVQEITDAVTASSGFSGRKVEKIVIFYTDKTFSSYDPAG